MDGSRNRHAIHWASIPKARTPARKTSGSLNMALPHEVVAANATIFGTFQLITELGMGVALLLGLFTPLAGLGATFFFFNLFLAYLNQNTGEWIWTYVLLVVAALVVALTRSGLAVGIDRRLARDRGKPPFPLLW
jgi:uncharacterized membrane protein YphA (DoxX/SURF4 family)